jgi:hypothetical protein
VPQPDGTWRLRAECYRERPCPDSPDILCGCGVNATYHFAQAQTQSAFVGLVRPLGKTIPEEMRLEPWTWRAEAAVVELLGAPPEMIPDLPPQLRERVCTYDVLQRAATRPLRLTDVPPVVPAQPDLEVEPDMILQARVVSKYNSELDVTWGSVRVLRCYDRRHGRPYAEYWHTPSFWGVWAVGRRDGPAVIIYDEAGRPRREKRYEDH